MDEVIDHTNDILTKTLQHRLTITFPFKNIMYIKRIWLFFQRIGIDI